MSLFWWSRCPSFSIWWVCRGVEPRSSWCLLFFRFQIARLIVVLFLHSSGISHSCAVSAATPSLPDWATSPHAKSSCSSQKRWSKADHFLFSFFRILRFPPNFHASNLCLLSTIYSSVTDLVLSLSVFRLSSGGRPDFFFDICNLVQREKRKLSCVSLCVIWEIEFRSAKIKLIIFFFFFSVFLENYRSATFSRRSSYEK